MLGVIKEIGVLAVVPALLYLAWSGWARTVRADLPRWRNGIGLAVLLILSLSWAGAVFLYPTFAHFLHYDPSGLISLKWVVFVLSHPVDLLALVLAVSLKRGPRVEAALAALIMVTCWPGGYV